MGRNETSWHNFCGQKSVVSSIRAHCDGALSKGIPLPHILLSGQSGMGKTQLAKSIAKEMGTDCHDIYASPQTKRWQLAKALSAVQKKGDLVFIDEIHALQDGVQELLYPAIDRHVVPVVDPESNRIKENEWLEISPFTLVCASDQIGKLKNALQQRLVLRFALQPYTEAEMRIIVGNRASEIGVLLSPQATRRIAQASRGIPRRARHLLHSLHTCLEDPSLTVTRAAVNRHLMSLGIDGLNLTDTDRNYLGVLARRGGLVGLETIALQLGLDDMSVKRDVEAYLISKELIGIDSRGRYLTEKGRRLA